MGTLATYQVFLFIASTIYQVDQRQKAKQEARRQAESAKDAAAVRNIRVTNSNLPIPEAFGECRIEAIPAHFHLDRNFIDARANPDEQIFGNLAGMSETSLTLFNLTAEGSAIPRDNYNQISPKNGRLNSVLAIQAILCNSEIEEVVTVEIDGDEITDEEYLTWAKFYINKNGGTYLNVAAQAYRPDTAIFDELVYATQFFKMNRDDPQYGGQPNTAYFLKGKKMRSFSSDLSGTVSSSTTTIDDELDSVAPVGIVISAGGDFAGGYTVVLAWTLVSGASLYSIEVSLDNNLTWTPVRTDLSGSALTMYTMHPLRNYRIRSISKKGVSEWDDVTTIDTSIPVRKTFDSYITDSSIPAPTDLVLQFQPSDKYQAGAEGFLSWSAVPNATKYRVAVKHLNPNQGDGTFLTIEDTSLTQVSYDFENTELIFSVTAIVDSKLGTSAVTDNTSLQSTPAPATLTVVLTASVGNISWSLVSGATGYIVQTSENGVSYTTLTETFATLNTTVQLSAKTSRLWIRVAAKVNNSIGSWKEWSGLIDSSVNDILEAPDNFVVNFHPTSVASVYDASLAWSIDTDAEAYVVESSRDGIYWTRLESSLFNAGLILEVTDGYYYYRVANLKTKIVGEWSYWEGYADTGDNTVLEDIVPLIAPTPLPIKFAADILGSEITDVIVSWEGGSGHDDFLVEYRKEPVSSTRHGLYTAPTGDWTVFSTTNRMYTLEAFDNYDSVEIRVAGRSQRSAGYALSEYIYFEGIVYARIF